MGIAEKALVLKRDFDEVYKAGASDFGLKGKGQGEFVHFENVHPIEHKVLLTVSDPTAKVKASGKNLAPINEVEVYTNTTENPFNYVTVWEGSLSGYSRISWKYDLQSVGSASAAFFRFTIDGATKYASADITWLNYPINNETLTKIEVVNWSGSVGRVYDIQLEVGSTITAFEPYIGAEYTAAADGTVEGVKSISPVMNILADKAGAIIDAECFLDPQAVITDLTNTVITLGGEI